jgi:ribosome-binding factor A
MTPTLELILDDVPENADDLNELLAEARRRDGEVEKLAKGAKHAGDPDPYIQKPQED